MALLTRALKALAGLTWRITYATVNAVYKTITRIALYLATVWLAVYFTLNSTAFSTDIMTLLDGVLPGYFDVETLQWGPLPNKITLLGINIRDPLGTPVIEVERLTTSVDLLALQGWAMRKAVSPELPIELRFNEVALRNGEVLVEVAEDGWIGIYAAFSDATSPPDGPKSPKPLVEVNNIVLEHVNVLVDVRREGGGAVRVDGRNINALARVLAREEVRVTGSRITSSSGVVQVDGAGPDGTTMDIPWRDFVTHHALWDAGLLVLNRADLVASNANTTVRGRLDIRHGETTVDARAVLTGVSTDDPLISMWTEDLLRFDADVTIVADGPFSWPHLDATITAKDLAIDTVEAGPVTLGLGLRTNGFERLARLSPLSIGLGDGVVHVDQLDVTVPWSGHEEQRIETRLRLDDVVPESLWDLGLMPADLSVPPVASGTVNGRIDATISKRLPLSQEAEWVVNSRLHLDADWDGDPDLPISTSVGAIGQASAHLIPEATWVAVQELNIRSGPDRASLTGRWDVDDDLLDFGVDATIQTQQFLEAFDVKDINCLAQLRDAHVTGTTGSPDLTGRLTAGVCRVLGQELEDLSANVRLKDGVLRVGRLAALTQYGKVKTDARVTLWDTDLTDISKTFPLQLSGLSASGVELSKLDLGEIKGIARIESNRFDFNLGDDSPSMHGSAKIEVRGLAVAGEVFHHFQSNVTADGRTIRVKNLDARTTSGSKLKGSGTYGLDSERFDAEVEATAVDLATAAILRKYALPTRGVVDLTASASGTGGNFSLKGRVKARRFVWGEIYLGDATIAFDRSKNSRRVRLTSPRFFRRTKLKEGWLELDRDSMPVRLTALAEVHDLDVLQVLPALRPDYPVLKVAAGDINFDTRFDSTTPTELTANIPDGAVTAVLAMDPTVITNEGQLWGSMVDSRLNVERLVARFADQRMAACGWIDLETDKLELDVAGEIRLDTLAEKFPSVREWVADLSGRIVTFREPNGTEPFESSCLRVVTAGDTLKKLGAPEGFLALRNTLDLPTVLGGLRFDQVSMIPRSLGRDIAIKDGVLNLKPSGGAAGSQEIVISPKRPLVGTFEDGPVQITGRAKLPDVTLRRGMTAWSPDKGKLQVRGQDIDWAVPQQYRVTLDPDVELSFAGLATDKHPTLGLTGKVEIVEGAYFENFSFFTRAVGNVLGRNDAWSRSLTDTFPALADMKLDVNVTGQSFLVQSDFGIGKTDLDTSLALRAAGTFGEPEVYGTVEVTDGTITYSIVRRDFEVTRGQLTFDGSPKEPMLDIEAETVFESHGNPQFDDGCVREDEDTVVTIRVTGRVPDFEPVLTSNQACSQVDVQYLILTGTSKTNAGSGSAASLDVFSADLTALLRDIINAPFVDVKVAPDTKGDARVEAVWRIRNVSLGVTSRKSDTGQQTYDARYRHKFDDDLQLEAIRRGADESRPDGRYQVRLKYTVPLD
ncbi:MAG: hypothetical protein ACI9WU_000034 [Myxococcota bacterium]